MDRLSLVPRAGPRPSLSLVRGFLPGHALLSCSHTFAHTRTHLAHAHTQYMLSTRSNTLSTRSHMLSICSHTLSTHSHAHTLSTHLAHTHMLTHTQHTLTRSHAHTLTHTRQRSHMLCKLSTRSHTLGTRTHGPGRDRFPETLERVVSPSLPRRRASFPTQSSLLFWLPKNEKKLPHAPELFSVF